MALNGVRNYGQILQGILARDIIDEPEIRLVEECIEDDLVLENETLGIFISKFPQLEGVINLNKIKFYLNKEIKVLGFLRTPKIIKTKNEEEMAFIEIYDEYSSNELIVFSDMFARYRNYIDSKHLFVVYGRVNERNKKLSIIVSKVERLGI